MTDRELFEKTYTKKYEELKSYFMQGIPAGICIAYSGGVDSTLLLKAAVESMQISAGVGKSDADARKSTVDTIKPVLAIILETQLHPHSDTEQAYQTAKNLGAHPEIIRVDEFQNPDILKNPVNRCYLCKHMLFTKLKELAASRGYYAVFDGTNKDDENEYRPGMKVLKELQIKSPLLELGITKSEVRTISAMLGLSTASSPSTPCLATRLPYGAYLDRNLLSRIHQGETLLRSLGFYNVRLRYHEPVLRIEIDCDAFEQLTERRTAVVTELKKLNFPYITLDLEGFRSGSMDIGLH